jgi:hypothetical protein
METEDASEGKKMQHRMTATATAAVVALFLLSGSGAAMANSGLTYTLSLAGGFVNIGSQEYTSSGGNPAFVSIEGSPNLAGASTFTYTIDASVEGTAVSGEATFLLNAPGMKVSSEVKLTDMIPAFTLSASAVPAFFVGAGVVKVNDVPVSPSPLPIIIESAYLNPFGSPSLVFIGTPDGSISIASTYDSAMSEWENVQTGGIVSDTSGAPLGSFTMTSGLTENLVTGTESDAGHIVLAGFSAPLAAFNSAGEFHGKSVVPAPGVDCVALMNGFLATIPGFSPSLLPPGTCALTGSISTGAFTLESVSGHTEIKGTYDTLWGVPAVGFESTVTATVTNE